MIVWLHSVPSWLAACVVVGMFLGLSCMGVSLVHRWSHLAERVAISGSFVGVVSALYGMILALFVVNGAGRVASMQGAAMNEAGGYATLATLFRAYPDSQRADLEARLGEMVNYVVGEERRALDKGGALRFQAQAEDDLLYGVAITKPPKQEVLHTTTLAHVRGVIQARGNRLFQGQLGVTNDAWAMLLAGALIIMVLTWLTPVLRIGSHLMQAGFVAILMGFAFFVLVESSHPIWGSEPLPIMQYFYQELGGMSEAMGSPR